MMANAQFVKQHKDLHSKQTYYLIYLANLTRTWNLPYAFDLFVKMTFTNLRFAFSCFIGEIHHTGLQPLPEIVLGITRLTQRIFRNWFAIPFAKD